MHSWIYSPDYYALVLTVQSLEDFLKCSHKPPLSALDLYRPCSSPPVPSLSSLPNVFSLLQSLSLVQITLLHSQQARQHWHRSYKDKLQMWMLGVLARPVAKKVVWLPQHSVWCFIFDLFTWAHCDSCLWKVLYKQNFACLHGSNSVIAVWKLALWVMTI